ncbi:MAG: stage III sporulation AC/AD family protein [Clostridia bacterium]|nr:stage III sporulation AC/AD family protein [Clostridia bacterium]
MSELFRLCGVALLGAVVVLFLKPYHSGQAGLTAVAALLLLLAPLIARYGKAIGELSSLLDGHSFEGYGALMLKSLGIGITVKVTGDVCRDLGEESLAGSLEIVGKLEILLLCFPLMKELLALLREVMG